VAYGSSFVLILGMGQGFLTMRLLNSLISDIVCTVLSFLGMMNVGNAHREDGCYSNTPMLHSHLISFVRTALCLCGIG
jgi:hypothetical protein